MRQILPRVIPSLLLKGTGLVKTVKFRDPRYLGDPRNIVKIFNDKAVDELLLLDITSTPEQQPIKFDLIREIVSEAFMPVAYGGGVRNLEDARKVLALGVEKIVVNTYAVENSEFIRQAALSFGSSSVVVCIDAKKTLLGKYEVYINGGRSRTRLDPAAVAIKMETLGAGEIIINSIDRDGTMTGYDTELVKSVTSVVTVPVIASGGAGDVQHLGEAVKLGGASAVAAGSMFVFQGKHRAVLVSFPEQKALRSVFIE